MSCRAAAFFPSSVQAQVSAKEPVFVPAQFHTYAIAIVRVPDTPIIQERLHGSYTMIFCAISLLIATRLSFI